MVRTLVDILKSTPMGTDMAGEKVRFIGWERDPGSVQAIFYIQFFPHPHYWTGPHVGEGLPSRDSSFNSKVVHVLPRILFDPQFVGRERRMCNRYPSDTNSEQLASDQGLILSPPEKKNMARLRRVSRGRQFFPFSLGRFRSPTGKCTQENVCTSSRHNDFSYENSSESHITVRKTY